MKVLSFTFAYFVLSNIVVRCCVYLKFIQINEISINLHTGNFFKERSFPIDKLIEKRTPPAFRKQ